MKSSWEEVQLNEDRLLKEQIRDEIMAMVPGRELDALVAKKVMGWTFSNLIKSWYPPNLRPENNAYGHKLRNYSTDIAAAWEVVEKMKDYKIYSDIHTASNCYMVDGYSEIFEDEIEHVECETAPHAICKAALLAVMEVGK
jgi:hypothetical protein